jgi:hypothetical protein
MLRHIQSELLRMRQRRRQLIAISAALVLIVVGSIAIQLPLSQPQVAIDDEQSHVSETITTADAGQDNTDATENLVSFEVIDDQQLLVMLEAAGHPSVLAQIDGKLVLLPLRNN